MGKFDSCKAWFSTSVSINLKTLWEENGGLLTNDINTVDYLFSDDASTQDTVRVFQKCKEKLYIIFNTSWINDSLQETNLPIENYVLLPIKKDSELWKNPDLSDEIRKRGKDWHEKFQKLEKNKEDTSSQQSSQQSTASEATEKTILTPVRKKSQRQIKTDSYSLRSVKSSCKVNEKKDIDSDSDVITKKRRKPNEIDFVRVPSSSERTEGADIDGKKSEKNEVSAKCKQTEKRPKRKSAAVAAQKLKEKNESSIMEDNEGSQKSSPKKERSPKSRGNKQRPLYTTSPNVFNEEQKSPSNKTIQHDTRKHLSPSEIQDVLGKKESRKDSVSASPKLPAAPPSKVTMEMDAVAIEPCITSPKLTMDKHKSMLIHKKLGENASNFIYGSFAGFSHIDDLEVPLNCLSDFIVNKNECKVVLKQ